MKKLFSILACFALILAGAGLLMACGEKPAGIRLNSTFKTEYYVGEDLDVTGGIIDYTKNGETIQIAIEKSMVTGFQKETAGTWNLVITYVDEVSTKTYTLTVPYIIKQIPDYPLDTTGVVKYKATQKLGSQDFYMGIIFKDNTMQMGDAADMTYGEGELDTYHTIYSRDFNMQNGTWEIVTKASANQFFKLINITADSFTVEVYYMPGADSEQEVDPIMTGSTVGFTLNFVKVA